MRYITWLYRVALLGYIDFFAAFYFRVLTYWTLQGELQLEEYTRNIGIYTGSDNFSEILIVFNSYGEYM